MQKLFAQASACALVSADQIFSSPVVETNHTLFNSLEDEIEEEELEHMDFKDVASYEFMLGFIDRSIDLSENPEELRESDDLDLSQFELNWAGSGMWVYERLETDMFLYEAGQRKKYHAHSYQEKDLGEDFSIWRALHPMTHQFTTIPDFLIEHNRMN